MEIQRIKEYMSKVIMELDITWEDDDTTTLVYMTEGDNQEHIIATPICEITNTYLLSLAPLEPLTGELTDDESRVAATMRNSMMLQQVDILHSEELTLAMLHLFFKVTETTRQGLEFTILSSTEHTLAMYIGKSGRCHGIYTSKPDNLVQ